MGARTMAYRGRVQPCLVPNSPERLRWITHLIGLYCVIGYVQLAATAALLGRRKTSSRIHRKQATGGFYIGFWMRTLHDIDLFGVLTRVTLDTSTSIVECLCLLVLSNHEGMVVWCSLEARRGEGPLPPSVSAGAIMGEYGAVKSLGTGLLIHG